MINILKPKEEYVVEYPEALEFAKKQVGIIWTPDEVSVEKLNNILFLSGLKLNNIKAKRLCYYKKNKLNLFTNIPENLNDLIETFMYDVLLPEEFNEYIWDGVDPEPIKERK